MASHPSPGRSVMGSLPIGVAVLVPGMGDPGSGSASADDMGAVSSDELASAPMDVSMEDVVSGVSVED
ncbi:MAG TPA: hypothetical protein VI076_02235, partial [Actinopolymorphaceae bacterium]